MAYQIRMLRKIQLLSMTAILPVSLAFSQAYVPVFSGDDTKGVIVYPGFPADVLFNFRLYSIAAQLVLWSAIGLIFAPLADRLLAPGPARAELRQVRETAGV